MSYLVLARKYRPQSFDDLVGQEHVARTLARAITSGRVAHAFLFTGVRGVGKTTSARLLAKCLCCVGPDGTATGPTPTPCQMCAPCQEIAKGTDLDVQEIDGASYNGVDEVRRLQETLMFRPARDRYKLYIVDEVHMLSTAAWNAFLKTLEEPPPHVKFLFATTEVHKVPVTILSRCQRYDFKLISTRTIATRLKSVLAAESIEAEEGAVSVLAREAAGSMRDAMSLLDQVIAFSGARLTSADVTEVLGVADRKVLYDLTRSVLTGDAARTVAIVDDLAKQGFDVPHVARDVHRLFSDLVKARLWQGKDEERLDLADEELAELRELCMLSDIDDLTRLATGFSRAFDEIARSSHPRAALEVALVRLARRPPLLPLDDLLGRIGDLEKRLMAAGGIPSRGGAGPSTGRPHTSSVSQRLGEGTGARPPLREAPANGPVDDVRAQGKTASGEASAEPTTLVGSVSEPMGQTEGALALAPVVRGHRDQPSLGERGSSSQSEVAAGAGSSGGMAAWRAIVEVLRRQRPDVAAVFEHAAPAEVSAARIVLAYGTEATFLFEQAQKNVELLVETARAYFGANTLVVLDMKARAAKGVTLAEVVSDEHREREERAKEDVRSHALVAYATELFQATIREIVLPDDLHDK